MAQCRGTTKSGNRCKREASPDSSFCGIHQDQEIRARETGGNGAWDWDAVMKTALGVGLVAGIILLRIRR